jgi:hypothetical protein
MFKQVRGGYAGESECKRCEEECIVASEERLRELEDKYEGYSVYDNRGERIGRVDDLFIDEDDREEYIGVKMGFLGRKSTLIPMDLVRVNEAEKAMEVSESKDRVKDAPSFDDDEDITPEYEDRIRGHFGLESLTDTSRGPYEPYSDTAEEGDDRTSSDQGSPGSTERGNREASTVDTERTGDRGPSGSPVSRQTDETETSEEGDRTKVRRRIIREEIVEEDQNP